MGIFLTYESEIWQNNIKYIENIFPNVYKNIAFIALYDKYNAGSEKYIVACSSSCLRRPGPGRGEMRKRRGQYW